MMIFITKRNLPQEDSQNPPSILDADRKSRYATPKNFKVSSPWLEPETKRAAKVLSIGISSIQLVFSINEPLVSIFLFAQVYFGSVNLCSDFNSVARIEEFDHHDSKCGVLWIDCWGKTEEKIILLNLFFLGKKIQYPLIFTFDYLQINALYWEKKNLNFDYSMWPSIVILIL